jgi:hypothetical protein
MIPGGDAQGQSRRVFGGFHWFWGLKNLSKEGHIFSKTSRAKVWRNSLILRYLKNLVNHCYSVLFNNIRQRRPGSLAGSGSAGLSGAKIRGIFMSDSDFERWPKAIRIDIQWKSMESLPRRVTIMGTFSKLS